MSYAKYLSIVIAIAFGLQMAITTGEAPYSDPIFKRAFLQICELVQNNYYEDSKQLEAWTNDCYKKARNFRFETGYNNFRQDIQTLLSLIQVSHLYFWDPLQVREVFTGESKESGMRIRNIEGHFMVVKLVDGGPAMRADIRLGDEVVSVNGKRPQNEEEIKYLGGVYSLLRKQSNKLDSVTTNVTLETLQIDQSPTLATIAEDISLLTIPTFVRAYFDDESWINIASQFSASKRIIADLRSNAGGDFTAMLKALSSFYCKPVTAGYLQKPRHKDGTSVVLENQEDPEYQIEIGRTASNIELRTFDGYPCFEGEVVVLIDVETASNAEIFANAIMRRDKSKVMGDFSAGQVVEATFFPLILGTGFSLSIPSSIFVGPQGERLEGVGVRPKIHLNYVLEEARNGQDNWIEEAANVSL